MVSDYSITNYCHVVINLCDQLANIIEMDQIDKHAEHLMQQFVYVYVEIIHLWEDLELGIKGAMK